MSTPAEARHYKVLDVLGRGGFGTVYRAELHGGGGFKKLVALKVLRDEVQAQTVALGRLRDEARLLGRLRHRAIVQVDGLVKLDGRWAVVMELVEGASLKELLERFGNLPPTVALGIVGEVASALHVAYDLSRDEDQPLRLLHRDVKPSNVQLTPTGGVKLLDFGVARAELDGRESQTGGVVYGSVPYMAPERLELVDTHRGDVYALGITLLELVAGRMPGGPTTDAAEHASRLEAGLAMLDERDGAEPLADLLRRVLAFDRDVRPDARGFERACRELRRRLEGPDLADWAQEVVPLLLDAREIQTEELSGATLSEQSTEIGGSGTLSGLLGAATTWDESETYGVDLDQTLDPGPPGAGASAGLPAPQEPAPSAEPAPRRRSRWPVLLAATGMSLGVGVAAVVAVALVLLVVGGFVAVQFWSFVDSGACAQSFTETRLEMLKDVAPSPGRGEVEQVLLQGRRACQAGDLGVLGASTLLLEYEAYAADGALSQREARLLRESLGSMID